MKALPFAAALVFALISRPAPAAAVPLFVSPSPAAAAVVATTTVPLSATVKDDCMVRRDTAQLVVDGAACSVWGEWAYTERWVDDGCGGYVETVYDYTTCRFYTPPPGLTLAPGSHAATLTVSDSLGRVASWRYDFTVRSAPPAITSLSPSDGSVVATTMPLFSAVISYAGTPQSVSMAVDGHAVASQYVASTGIVSYVPPTAMGVEMTHTVSVTVVDPYGSSVSSEAAFRIQLAAPMPLPVDCLSCHEASRFGHPQQNCSACHGGPERPVRNCPACHAYGHLQTFDFADIEGQGSYTCTTCHNTRYPLVPAHPTDSVHDTSRDMSTCLQCHVGSLTREHAQRTDGLGRPYDCYTCHASANPIVTAAIAGHDTNCDTCHGATSHESAHVTGMDTRCTSCHATSLTSEHLANPVTQATQLTCDSCHSSTRADVTWAIVSGDVSCSACHDTAHSLGLVDLPRLPLYAGFTWSAPLAASAFAGESWMPTDTVTGKVLVSDRKSGIVGDDVWAFYRDRMTAEGWILTSAAPAAGADRFSATWTKKGHAVVLWFYTGQTHAAAADGRGGRIELIYR